MVVCYSVYCDWTLMHTCWSWRRKEVGFWCPVNCGDYIRVNTETGRVNSQTEMREEEQQKQTDVLTSWLACPEMMPLQPALRRSTVWLSTDQFHLLTAHTAIPAQQKSASRVLCSWVHLNSILWWHTQLYLHNISQNLVYCVTKYISVPSSCGTHIYTCTT